MKYCLGRKQPIGRKRNITLLYYHIGVDLIGEINMNTPNIFKLN